MKPVLPLVLFALLLTSCEQPTVDPDQKLRDTIVGRAWTPDPAFPPTAPSPTITFYVGGQALIDQKDGSWSYINAVFTITDPYGDSYKTTSPTFDSSHFSFYYGPSTAAPQLLHLIR